LAAQQCSSLLVGKFSIDDDDEIEQLDTSFELDAQYRPELIKLLASRNLVELERKGKVIAENVKKAFQTTVDFAGEVFQIFSDAAAEH